MSRFDLFPIPWLKTAASDGCRLKSAATVDAEDVPGAHHAEQKLQADERTGLVRKP